MKLIEDINKFPRKYHFYVSGKFRHNKKLTDKQVEILNSMGYDRWYEDSEIKHGLNLVYMFKKGWLVSGDITNRHGNIYESCEEMLLDHILFGEPKQPISIYKLRDKNE